MDKWDYRMLELADFVACWSKDPSTRVGAVVADEEHRVLGIGYNGFPRGVEDAPERLNHRPTKYKLIVHAEANAILNSNSMVRGATLYVSPFHPCEECAKLIVQAGVKRVVCRRLWPRCEGTDEAQAILREGGVDVEMEAKCG